ncbi:ankyrin repeat domain-containing protein 50-like [Physella acuta]|uniref:ankyrin repeat domain-containing protein 50-like n=1 Tax=Physella acuta TaxID=109671 RepID=UPI0027DD26CC|nr:ankyrin repeat domain-containing protein 50-like [Physella acuta]
MTPVMHASSKGHNDTVKLLIVRQANIYNEDINGWTCLSHAANNGHNTTVQLWLDNNVDINKNHKDVGNALMLAASRGYSTTVKLLLDNNADAEVKDNIGWIALANVKDVDKDKMTAIMHGVAKRHVGILKVLINNGADVNAKDRENPSQGRTKMVKLLLQFKAPVNGVYVGSKHPLMCAVENRHIEIVQLLLQHGADLNLGDKEGLNPLALAVSKGFSDIVQVLLDYIVSSNNADERRFSPLIYALNAEEKERVTAAISTGDSHQKNAHGKCALKIALSDGNKEVFRLLQKYRDDDHCSECCSITDEDIYNIQEVSTIDDLPEEIKKGLFRNLRLVAFQQLSVITGNV